MGLRNWLRKLFKKNPPPETPPEFPTHISLTGRGFELAPTEEEIREEAGRRSALADSRSVFTVELATAAREVNPEVILSKYTPTVGAEEGTLEDHPDWVVRNEAGEPLTQLNADVGVLLDPGNLEVRARIADSATKATMAGFDAVMLDECLMVAHLAPGFDGINPRTGRVFTTAEFRSEQLENVRATRDAIGPDKILAANSIGNGKRYFQEQPYAFADVCDMLIAEGYRGHSDWSLDTFMSPQQWKATLEMGYDLGSRRCILGAHCEFDRHVDVDPVLREAYDMFLYCTFLLGLVPEYGIFSSITQDVTVRPALISPAYYDYWKYNLGAPLDRYKAEEIIHYRDFSNGTVLVNPSDQPSSITLPRDYWTLEGEKVTERVTEVHLLPHTGKILFLA